MHPCGHDVLSGKTQGLLLRDDSPPKTVSFVIDLHENLVTAPAPVQICMIMDPTVPYLTSKHRAETVPPESYRLMADVDAPLMKKVFNIAER